MGEDREVGAEERLWRRRDIREVEILEKES